MAAAITTVGKGLVAAAMLAGAVAKYIQHGTGVVDPVVGNTALGTPSADVVVAGTESVSASVKYRVVGAVTGVAANQNITEVGLFATATPTSMLYRETFGAIAIVTNDTITYTLDITVA